MNLALTSGNSLSRTLFVAALFLGMACQLPPVGAATHRLDDSASQVISPNARMEWRSLAPGRAADHEFDDRLLFGAGPRMTAQWQTQGKLLAGRLVSGERGLVYAGPITQPLLEDQMLVYLRTDGRWMSNSRRLAFHFELDTD